MFNKGARGDDRQLIATTIQSSGNGKRGQFSVLGADLTITGNVSATAELHLEGRIEGDVDCGTLLQGAESQIVGNVRAESARLAGSIEGTVRVRQLTVERTARITGDVEYENITMENGGHIDGRLKHMSRTVSVSAPATSLDPTPVAPAGDLLTPNFGQSSAA
jgi:cytoskeletal protein CcmA (bactofilin family)